MEKNEDNLVMVVWQQENEESERVGSRVHLTNSQFESITSMLGENDTEKAKETFENGIVDSVTGEKISFEFDKIIELSFEREK